MEEHEEWAESSGLWPRGLLTNVELVIRVLDSERWSRAEQRTAELIGCIQPNQPSEVRRNAVADYVQRLIMKCFPCQVFTFGSVPLKTYLPDGDIDLTAFSNNQSLKDTWAHQVRDMLEEEEKNENAEFHVKEVQYIQAEVKLIKCLVANIVVDISFNQLGGLCTLCFLEEVDHLINRNHLFKRSIILIKAWCYYESRILGAHHGLISTYALETLVLYIFHVFNNSFSGPLEVLYRFLEFFSNFDWDNFCVSLWGPVPISSLPDVTAEPPRKDGGELLLSKLFLDACSSVYAVFPGGQENQGLPFISKHFNVIDPLRVNNNLGRSVSKGNFFRIRSAFGFGAKRLAKLLDCPKENLIHEVNQFFMNTWDRHGSGQRPDAPGVDLTSDDLQVFSGKMLNGKSDGNLSTYQVKKEVTDKNERNWKSDQITNDIQCRFVFSRTRSSPELTDTYDEVTTLGRHAKPPETVKMQPPKTLNNDSSYIRDQSLDAMAEPNSFHRDATLDALEEQDLVNMMASTSLHGFNGQLHFPFNWSSGQLPFPIPPSVLASMGYNQRLGSANFPVMDTNVQFPHGMISLPFNHYFPGLGLNPTSENSADRKNDNFSSIEVNNNFCQESEAGPNVEFDPENRNNETPECDNFVPSSWASNRAQQNHANEKRGPIRKEHLSDIRDVYAEERLASSRLSSTAHGTSARSKTSSESSWDGSSSKGSKSTRGRRGNKTESTTSGYRKGKMMSNQFEDDDDRNSEMAEGSQVPQSIITRQYEGGQTSGSDPILPIAPMLIRPGSQQRTTDNSGVIAFYPTGPPVPFLTMLPVYNIPPNSGTPDSHFGGEEYFDNSDQGQNLDGHSDNLNTFRGTDEHKSDILNSDFSSHWQNLQYGRFCQNPKSHGPVVYPSPVMVPPAYLQGRVPWDGPGRPQSANMNLLTQLMSPGILPISPLQSLPSRPPNMFQHYVDDIPRYRSGTGTYLPNPKVPVRDRHSPGTQRGNYNHGRNDNRGGDREGNWNANSKSRGGGRNYNRSQSEKLNSRADHESRADRSWRHGSHPSYQCQNGPNIPPNMAYGLYPSGVSSNGPGVVMMYPFDHNSTYEEQLEFGSLGAAVGFSSGNEQAQPAGDGTRLRGGQLEDHRFHGQHSSPDRPSSSHYHRKKSEKW